MSRLRNLSRRDFLGGVALGAAAGGLGGIPGLARALESQGGATYPPALTGLRGSHPGSFEVAHSVAWAGAKYPVPKQQTDKTYDLVVVGGGISGLAAAPSQKSPLKQREAR